MRRSKFFAAPSSAFAKIQRLYKLLVKEKALFEQVASHISDRGLRCTVLSLAQQNNQYAAELFSYIKCAGGRDFPGIVIEPPSSSMLPAAPDENYPDESGILAYCRSNEKKIMLAYQRLLRESLVYEGLQKMISYQLSGIVAAFVQLKLLSSLKKV